MHDRVQDIFLILRARTFQSKTMHAHVCLFELMQLRACHARNACTFDQCVTLLHERINHQKLLGIENKPSHARD